MRQIMACPQFNYSEFRHLLPSVLNTEGDFLILRRLWRFFMSSVTEWGWGKLRFHKIQFNDIVYKNFHHLRSTRLETVGFQKVHVKKYFSKIVDFRKISCRVFSSVVRISHGKLTKLLLNKAKRLVGTLTKLQVSTVNGFFF